MSYGSNYFELACAGYIDKIFKGARPADLPVAFPTKFELSRLVRAILARP
jgi:hypothetical protein